MRKSVLSAARSARCASAALASTVAPGERPIVHRAVINQIGRLVVISLGREGEDARSRFRTPTCARTGPRAERSRVTCRSVAEHIHQWRAPKTWITARWVKDHAAFSARRRRADSKWRMVACRARRAEPGPQKSRDHESALCIGIGWIAAPMAFVVAPASSLRCRAQRFPGDLAQPLRLRARRTK